MRTKLIRIRCELWKENGVKKKPKMAKTNETIDGESERINEKPEAEVSLIIVKQRPKKTIGNDHEKDEKGSVF
jgi:hypothetical protein